MLGSVNHLRRCGVLLHFILSWVVGDGGDWVTLEVEVEEHRVFGLQELCGVLCVVDVHSKNGSILQFKVFHVQNDLFVLLQVSDYCSVSFQLNSEVLVFLHLSSLDGDVELFDLFVHCVLNFFIEVLDIEGR
jgi:hypothetical protein